MSVEAAERNLEALHARLGRVRPAAVEASEEEVAFAGDAVLAQLVRAMLAWEAGEAAAKRGVGRLCESFVDCNELRVCLPEEACSLLGVRYPRGSERCERLHHTLNAIFRRENATTLAHLQEMPKREARQYLEELTGSPKYVVCRVTLLALGGHAVPIDERLRRVLEDEGISPEVSNAEELSSWLERRIRAGDARGFHGPLEALAEKGPEKGAEKAAGQGTDKGPDKGLDKGEAKDDENEAAEANDAGAAGEGEAS